MTVRIPDEVLPRYSRKHFEHYKQVMDWYMDFEKNKEQLTAFHCNRALHFEQWLSEREKAIARV